jgi:hypothetical protein
MLVMLEKNDQPWQFDEAIEVKSKTNSFQE